MVKRFDRGRQTWVRSPVVADSRLWLLETAFGRGFAEHTLLKIWDGSAWESVPIPDPDDGTYVVSALDVTDDGVAWLAGAHDTATGDSSVVLRWDGQGWEKTTTPGTRVTTITDIEMWSPHEGWAVGHHSTGANDVATLALHWEGEQWHLEESPGSGSTATLRSVSIADPTDVWAVGSDPYPLALHWNGSEWTSEPLPEAPNGYLSYDVEAISKDDALIVGGWDRRNLEPALVSWNGSNWTEIVLEDVPRIGFLRAVDGSEAWVVGDATIKGDRSSPLHARRTDGRWKRGQADRPPRRRAGLNDIVVAGDGRTAWAMERSVLLKACFDPASP